MITNQYLHTGFFVLAFVLLIPFSFAQPAPHLQVIMIGNGSGPYHVPVGVSAEFKFEIFNAGPGDVYLDDGFAYLDPNLNGNWLLVHSESLGHFHVSELRSAIWTLNLTVPMNVQASNATNGIPRVVLLLKITYSTTSGLQTEQGVFLLNVPGAALRGPNYLPWIAGIMMVAVVVVLGGMLHSKRAKRNQNSRSD